MAKMQVSIWNIYLKCGRKLYNLRNQHSYELHLSSLGRLRVRSYLNCVHKGDDRSRCMFKQEKRKWCALRVIFSGLVEWENMRKPSPTKRNGRRPQNICRSSLIISGHSGVHHWSVELTGFPSVRRYIPCTSESSNASWKNKIRTS